MFLSLGIVYRERRCQIGFRLLSLNCRIELPLPVAGNALHGTREVQHKVDILVPMSALLGGLCPYQCPQQGFPEQVFASSATRGSTETPNPEVSELPESQQFSRR